MAKIYRDLKQKLNAAIERGKSILLLGPRQVGKTTLLTELELDLTISLARPAIRQQYEKDIESFSQEIEALASKIETKPFIAIDEIQKVPELMDAVQDLIDRQIAQFILTGSSARKLKTQHSLNWLPGRLTLLHLDPLTINELPKTYNNLNEMLIYGSLPGIVIDDNNEDREQDLQSYVTAYLEEEVRQEALVRKLGDFAKCLQFAAASAGQTANFNRISQDIGVAQTTIANYYQILEDCLIMERIEPFAKQGSNRKRLIKACKYLFFDIGVRRIAADEGEKLPEKIMGQLFEQFVGLELLRYTRQLTKKIKLNFWRDVEGREVDWVLNTPDKTIPVEVKWTNKPSQKDTRHLKIFLNDYQQSTGYIICRCKKPRKLDGQILALPWQMLRDVFVDIT